MSNPVRRCAGCRLKVETLQRLDDGRSYCGSCAERVLSRLDGHMTTPPDAVGVEAEPPLVVPGPREEPRVQESTAESSIAPPQAAREPAPPPAAPSAAAPSAPAPSAPAPRPAPAAPAPTPLPASTEVPAAPRNPRETLELLTGLLQEHDRLAASRAEIAAKLAEVDEQLRAIAGRIDGVHTLLRPDVA
jgi:hypothetical protein